MIVEGTASRFTNAGVVNNCTWIGFTVGVLHGPRSPEAVPYSAAGKIDVTVRWLDANGALLVRSEQTAWVAPRFSIAGTNPCVVVPPATRKVEVSATMYRWSNRGGWVQIDTATVPVTAIPAPSTWPLDDPYRSTQLFTYVDTDV